MAVLREGTQNDNRLSRVLAILAGSLLLSLCAQLVASHVGADDGQDLEKVDWWKKTNFYYIYVRSFRDSDGDGESDLRGIAKQLSQLKGRGVEAIILSPFYHRPIKNGGYDVQDHRDIGQEFGTMADFEALVQEVKSQKMRIVIDFVPNHTSKQHEWFKCSERALEEPERCGKYRDYYVWSDSKRHNNQYPCNWISRSSGRPAWTWSKIRKQFYLHQFSPEQPDLNFTNPDVQEEIMAIARFWLSKGVDGLRVSSLNHLFVNKYLTDRPVNRKWQHGDDPRQRLLHKCVLTSHEIAKIVEGWRRLCKDEFPDDKKVIITEADDNVHKVLEYYGNAHRERFADLSVNTELFKLRIENLRSDYIEKLALSWIDPRRMLDWPSEQGAMSPWILWAIGNQDVTRVVNRVGQHNVFFLRLLAYMLPGVPVNYYGDELPSKDDFAHDKNARKPVGAIFGREWRAGSSGVESKLKQFVDLQKLRKEYMNIFVFGDLVFFRNEGEDANMLLAVARTHEKFGNLLMLTNLNPEKDTEKKIHVSLKSSVSFIEGKQMDPPKLGWIVLSSRTTGPGALCPDKLRTVDVNNLWLAPSQTILIHYKRVSSRRVMFENLANNANQ